MTLNPIDLLSQLGSGVRPDSAAKAPSSIDQADFADLLEQVKRGGISSNQPVQFAPGVNVQLSPSQLQRLGVALDAAEAAGHDRVLALIDGQALTIDVPGRMVIESSVPSDARLLTDLDAVINVPDVSARDLRSLFSRGGRGHPEASPLASLDTIRNRSLSELLDQP